MGSRASKRCLLTASSGTIVHDFNSITSILEPQINFTLKITELQDIKETFQQARVEGEGWCSRPMSREQKNSGER